MFWKNFLLVKAWADLVLYIELKWFKQFFLYEKLYILFYADDTVNT